MSERRTMRSRIRDSLTASKEQMTQRAFQRVTPYDPAQSPVQRFNSQPETPTTPIASPDQHNLHDNDSFNRIEELYLRYSRTDTNGNRDDQDNNTTHELIKKPENTYIDTMDPRAVADSRLMELSFTAEEISQLDTSNNAELEARKDELAKARQAIDEKQATIPTSVWGRIKLNGRRWNALRTTRREIKEQQQAFNALRDAYREQAITPESEQSSLYKLTMARSVLAETTFDARNWKTGRNKKHNQALKVAQATYRSARNARFEEVREQFAHELDGSDESELQFVRSFSDHEDGALAGEEAQHYLTTVNDEDQKSWFQRKAEWYNGLSTKKKIIYGAGAAAVVGLATGAVGGAAAAGAAYSLKFTRNYFNSEGGRLAKQHGTERAQQENSVAYAGTFETSEATHQEMRHEVEYLRDHDVDFSDNMNRLFADAVGKRHANKRIEAIEHDRKNDAKNKGYALLKAAAWTAGPASLAGLASEFAPVINDSAVGHAYHGIHNWLSDHTGNHDAPTTNQTQQPDTPSRNSTGSGNTNDNTVEASTTQFADTFGEHTPTHLHIDIESGDNLWSEVREQVAAANTGDTFAQNDAHTAEIIERIREQTGRSITGAGSLSDVYAGDTFDIDLVA